MTTDAEIPDEHLTVFALPHPATRRAVAYLSTVFAARRPPIRCDLATAPAYEPVTVADAIYLRPGASDAASLAVTADVGGAPHMRGACALIAMLDDRCHRVPRVSVEGLLADPHAALRMIAERLLMSLGDEVYAAADTHIAALREDMKPYDHPLPFLAALEPAGADATWLDQGLIVDDGEDDPSRFVGDGVSRTLLVAHGSDCRGIDLPVNDEAAWQIEYVTPHALGRWKDHATASGMIYLHHIGAEIGVDGLLDRIAEHVVPGGILCGREQSEAAAEIVVANLTRSGDAQQWTFVLSGSRWLGLSPAWCR